MACINLYKMNFNKVDDFLDDLKSSNYLAKPNKKIDKDTCEFKFTLYLCEAKKSNDEISWNWLLNEFDESPLYVYKSPRAILFIEKVCDEREDIYAATFGSSFFKVDKYCDRDFGFKFAARMEYTNIKTTTLTSPNSKRSKMINTYVDYNEFDFNSGESFAKLKVNAKLDENFDLFKPALEIGNSIRFNTDKANIDGIINIILYVEKILEISDNDVKYKIPLFKEVKNEESIKKLNESLNKAIQSNVLGDSKCNLLSVPEIDIIGASEVFNGNDNEFELIYYKNASKKYDNLSMDVIKSFCIENNINSIEKVNKIKIRLYKDGDSVVQLPLKNVIEYTDEEYKCIYTKTKWYMFNHDYITYLNDSISEIDASYNDKFDFNDLIHNRFINDKYEVEKNDEEYEGKSEDYIKDKLKKKYYAERCYNSIREEDGNFKCYDRKDTSSGFEKMDLYEIESKTMFAVKIGKSSGDLCYAIDQSITALKKYKHKEITDMPPISRVGLWFILEKKKHLTIHGDKVDLTSLDMLMLKNRIDQWKKEVRLAGYTPVIYVNYRTKTK